MDVRKKILCCRCLERNLGEGGTKIQGLKCAFGGITKGGEQKN